jgi:hypothetical protein
MLEENSSSSLVTSICGGLVLFTCLNLRVDRSFRLAEKSPGWRVVVEDDIVMIVVMRAGVLRCDGM